MQFIQLSLTAVALAGVASALGINCEGSSGCAAAIGNMRGVLAAVQSEDQDQTYYDQQHIGCANNLCAFYQNGASGTAGDAAGHITNIINHGCTKCGSDPTSSGNDVSNGELTVNYVSNP